MSVELKQRILDVESAFRKEIEESNRNGGLEELRIRYLGRKGLIKELFGGLAEVPAEHRREAGQLLNELKGRIESALTNGDKKPSVEKRAFDHTLPGDAPPVGRCHPLTLVLRQIKSCFLGMGFSIAQGPEIETEYYNFEALNIPQGHPARDMQDTFYVRDGVVLRTHTSPVQVRVMENRQPPVRIISPGRCYRHDTPDATHSPMFHQVEGLCVDEGISFADLKGTILAFAKRMFGSDMRIRFRPSFFPFTEPSAEYDFSCLICRGKGCRVCKGTGWIESSGAGMVNPAVFRYVNYDPEKYTGFAFGMGVERIAMLVYEVHDIRMFYENDMRFLDQF